MKRFALIVAICLAASGAAWAQQDMGNVKSVGASYTTGTVESNALDSLTFRDDSGQLLTVLFDDGTVGALGHPAGSHVRINYHRNDQGQAIADEIQGIKSDAELQAKMPEATVISEPVMPSGAPIAEAQVAVTEPAPAAPAAEPIVVEQKEETAQAQPLPKTASNLYGLALLGLAALSSASILRISR